MTPRVLDVDLNKITDLASAKAIISQLFETLAVLFEENKKLAGRIEGLEAEVRRLKNLPPRPKFKENKDYAASKKVEKRPKGSWHKSAKLVEIDREEDLPVPFACECGSTKLKTIRS